MLPFTQKPESQPPGTRRKSLCDWLRFKSLCLQPCAQVSTHSEPQLWHVHIENKPDNICRSSLLLSPGSESDNVPPGVEGISLPSVAGPGNYVSVYDWMVLVSPPGLSVVPSGLPSLPAIQGCPAEWPFSLALAHDLLTSFQLCSQSCSISVLSSASC
jgi:hypothetical protein